MNSKAVISVPEELMEHYKLVKDLRDMALNSPDAEISEQVKTIAAVTSLLKDLATLQERVYNSEKFAVLTHVIIGTLRDIDPEIANKVVEVLEDRLAGYN